MHPPCVPCHPPQPLAAVAATVSIVTARDLETRLAFDPADLFRNEPGLSVRRDPSRFGYTAITVRGLTGNRVLVETDGVPDDPLLELYQQPGRHMAVTLSASF